MLRQHLTRSAILLAAATDLGGSAASEPPAAEAAQTKPLTIGEQLRAAISTKAGLQRELDAARAELAEAGQTIATLTTDLGTANSALTTAQGSIKTLTDEGNTLRSRVQELEAAAKTSSEQALDIVAGTGIAAAALPKAKETAKIADGEKTARSTWGGQFETK